MVVTNDCSNDYYRSFGINAPRFIQPLEEPEVGPDIWGLLLFFAKITSLIIETYFKEGYL